MIDPATQTEPVQSSGTEHLASKLNYPSAMADNRAYSVLHRGRRLAGAGNSPMAQRTRARNSGSDGQ